MLELVFVIVIMGILAKFGVDLIKQTYESYARTVVFASLESKTENAIMEISNRLRERIPDSVIFTTGNSIQWIGKDIDTWNDGGWSGIADLRNAAMTSTNIVTPATALSGTAANYAVYFIQNDFTANPANFYIANSPIMHGVNSYSTGNIVLSQAMVKASEHYIIARHAYLLQFNAGTGDLNLTVWTPWNVSDGTKTYLMADNVSDFFITNYQGGGGGFIVHLCMDSNNMLGEDYSICKQKFIF